MKISKMLRASSPTILGLLSLALTAATTGCASIVGADDYQVATAEGTAGNTNGQGGADGGVSSGTSGSEAAGASGSGGRPRVEEDASTTDVTVMKEASVVVPPMDASHGDGNVADTGKPVAAGSGGAICTTTCGEGLTCMHTSFGPSGLCVGRCPNSQTECAADHTCLHGTDPASGFDWSCIQNCTNETCPTGMTCLHLKTVSVCEPTDWLPTGLGLGDDCVLDSQCTSGQCLNKPNGWCSRPCHAYDTDFDYCDGDYLGKNYYDQYNSCIKVQGAYKCAPGCEGDSTVCTNYPGTTCKSLIDIDGLSESVCTP